MSLTDDKRLRNALGNMSKALSALDLSATTPVTEPRDLSGIIKDFEILYELSWKTLKTFLEKQGHIASTARQTFSLGYQSGLIKDETTWVEMIEDRNKTVHTCDEKFARALCERIRLSYLPEFKMLFTEVSQ